MSVSPSSARLLPGQSLQLGAIARSSTGDSSTVPVVWSATGGTVASTTNGALYTAGTVPGSYQVIAAATGGAPADTSAVIITDPSAQAIVTTPQWTVIDDGHTVLADGPVLRVRFAYAAEGFDGWFRGGGGRDGSMVELYYKPTSATRNLAFRSGVWGGKKEGVDYFAATGASVDVVDHSSPDYASGSHGVMRRHRVWEDGGRLFAEFEFDFMSWRITRTTVLDPLGDITVNSHIEVITAGQWNYLSHSVHFALAPVTLTNGTAYAWGGKYQTDAESFHAWSDMDGGRYPTPYEYVQPISSSVNRNSAIYDFGRTDNYSGFMLDDRNGNDPDIIVIGGDSTTRSSPFQRVAESIGGSAYVETGIFTPAWANGGTEGATNWFYATIRCCPAQYSNPMNWPVRSGWDESFHILLRRNVNTADYLPLWQARAHRLSVERPAPKGGASVRLDSLDRLYHVTAAPGAQSAQFTWTRSFTAPRDVDYRTAFIVEGVPAAKTVTISGVGSPAVQAWRGTSGRVLVHLVGIQPSTPVPYTITVGP